MERRQQELFGGWAWPSGPATAEYPVTIGPRDEVVRLESHNWEFRAPSNGPSSTKAAQPVPEPIVRDFAVARPKKVESTATATPLGKATFRKRVAKLVEPILRRMKTKPSPPNRRR